jgi:hypothetical protein
MKGVAVFLIFCLANTMSQCAKPALNAFAKNPTMWTPGLGYFFLTAVLVVGFVLGRKYLVK